MFSGFLKIQVLKMQSDPHMIHGDMGAPSTLMRFWRNFSKSCRGGRLPPFDHGLAFRQEGLGKWRRRIGNFTGRSDFCLCVVCGLSGNSRLCSARPANLRRSPQDLCADFKHRPESPQTSAELPQGNRSLGRAIKNRYVGAF